MKHESETLVSGGVAAPAISVVIPALNEEARVHAAIASARGAGGGGSGAPTVEVIVVDGGSSDRTVEVAQSAADVVICSGPGRGRQMSAGAAVARGEVLVFLHADSRLPAGYEALVRRVLAAPRTVAGAFPLALETPDWRYRIHEAVANFRSRVLQRPFGDQALFMRRAVYERVGGLRDMPLMEDVDLVERLRRLGLAAGVAAGVAAGATAARAGATGGSKAEVVGVVGVGRIRLASRAVTTSPRRWERHGPVRLSVLHLLLMLGYRLGMSTERLRRWRDAGRLLPPPPASGR